MGLQRLALARVCAIFSVMCDRHCRQLQLHECLPPVLATRMVTTRNWKMHYLRTGKIYARLRRQRLYMQSYVGTCMYPLQNVLDQKRNLNTPSVSFWCLRNVFWTNIFSLCDNLKTKRCKSVQFEYIGGCATYLCQASASTMDEQEERKISLYKLQGPWNGWEMRIVSFYQLKIELVSARMRFWIFRRVS